MTIDTIGAPQYFLFATALSLTMLTSGTLIDNCSGTVDSSYIIEEKSSNTDLFYIIDESEVSSNNIVITNNLQDNLNKLEEILRLPRNWNGNNADMFSYDLIAKAKTLLLGLSIQPEVFPTAADSIQFEYDGLEDSYLEFQISEKETADIYLIDINGEEREFAVPCSITEIEKVVKEFYG